MAYAQDTIISANAANELALVIDGLLMDAGWTVVETLNPAGTNTPINRIYKSAAGDNQCGYDWYFAMMWKTTGTESWLQMLSGGAYDAGTHIMTQIPVSLSHSPTNTYADFATGDQWGGFNVNVATAASGNVTPIGTSRGSAQARLWFATTIPSSAFGFWASVTLDHVALFSTIAGVNGPWNYLTGTLDVDPEWVALNSSPVLGNGVAVNPVMQMFGVGSSASIGAPTSRTGLSVAIKGSNNTTRIGATERIADNVGAILPVLSGPWLPAYAWRSAYYLASASSSSDSTGTDPTWDFPSFGDGFHIGDAIDWWQVRGGAIGDTVVIDGATYVLSGTFAASGAPSAVTVAVLVE